MKIKPITPNPEDVASLRRKLREIVTRMKKDYDKWLKPLVLQMTEKQPQAEGIEDLLNVGDAVNFLTAYEAARKLRVLKSKVLNSILVGEIKNAVQNNGEWLIPEDEVKLYGMRIGKFDPQEEINQLFHQRVEKLTKKYNDLFYVYESMSRKFTEKMYQKSKRQFEKQFKKTLEIDVMKILAEKGLKEAFENQVAMNVNLIKSLPQKYFADIQSMVIRSTTGGFEYEGGLQKAIQDLTKVTRTKAKLIARDQASKAVSTFTQLRFTNLGSRRYIWRNSKDRRVAGNPAGLYPKVDPKSKTHGDHWKREGKIFDWNNPPPDGNPGMPINCRCWAEPIFNIEE